MAKDIILVKVKIGTIYNIEARVKSIREAILKNTNNEYHCIVVAEQSDEEDLEIELLTRRELTDEDLKYIIDKEKILKNG